jgi:hypothetical protein
MICPRCGSRPESDDLKYCKSCGANLDAVRQALTVRGSEAKGETKSDWTKTWVTDLASIPGEIKRIKREQQTVFQAEENRHKEIKGGVITSSIGLSLMIFLFVFMEGIVRGGNVPHDGAEILSRVWIAGVIPFFIGLGLIFNGVVVSKRLVDLTKREIDQRERLQTLELSARNQESPPLPAADRYEFNTASPSVTEHTTRELRESGSK